MAGCRVRWDHTCHPWGEVFHRSFACLFELPGKDVEDLGRLVDVVRNIDPGGERQARDGQVTGAAKILIDEHSDLAPGDGVDIGRGLVGVDEAAVLGCRKASCSQGTTEQDRPGGGVARPAESVHTEYPPSGFQSFYPGSPSLVNE